MGSDSEPIRDSPQYWKIYNLRHLSLKNQTKVMENVWEIFSFHEKNRVAEVLVDQGLNPSGLEQTPMCLEDAFIGYTGRY